MKKRPEKSGRRPCVSLRYVNIVDGGIHYLFRGSAKRLCRIKTHPQAFCRIGIFRYRTVARLGLVQQRVHKSARVKRAQIVYAFAHADVADGDGAVGGKRGEDAAFCRTVEFGDDKTGQS